MMDNALGNQLWSTYENLTLRDGVASILSPMDFNDYFLGLVAFKYLFLKPKMNQINVFTWIFVIIYFYFPYIYSI